MKREQLIKFIRESRELAKGASAEKRLKLLMLIKESTKRIKISESNEIYKLNLTEVENDIGGEIQINNSVFGNQHLFKYLDKVGHLGAADYLIDSKVEQYLGNKIINESIDIDDSELNQVFDRFGNFFDGNDVSVGDKICVLQLEATDYLRKQITLSGFLNPLEVEAVSDSHVWLEDESIYPKIVSKGLKRWSRTLFFKDIEKAAKCKLTISLFGHGKFGSWNIDIKVDDKNSIDESIINPQTDSSKNTDYLDEA